jgi:hypothetical protein
MGGSCSGRCPSRATRTARWAGAREYLERSRGAGVDSSTVHELRCSGAPFGTRWGHVSQPTAGFGSTPMGRPGFEPGSDGL